MTKNDQIVARVSEIYEWIESRQLANKAIAGKCLACGKCCDFESYGHKLFVTTPEMIYFVEKIGKTDVIVSEAKQSQALEIEKLPRRPGSSGLLIMTSSRCPYQVEGKCSVHAHRFSGCRIFCCKGKAMFQSELTEAVIKKFKALCSELQIPYRYVELSNFLTAENAGNF
jgi:Fe-S-cluster containining protein